MVETVGKTFGLTHSPIKAKISAGPATYSPDKLKTQNYRFTMKGKLEDVEFNANKYKPGPGNYNPDPAKLRNFKNRFGGKERFFTPSELLRRPGPGTYEQNYMKLKQTAPISGFGTLDRNGPAVKKYLVGPGSYATRHVIGTAFDGPRKSMGEALTFDAHMKETKMKPGPGEYNDD